MTIPPNLFKQFVLPLTQWVEGRDTLNILANVERTQRLPAEQIRALQFARVQQVVRHAYDTVPFYQRAFRQAGVVPEHVRTWEDFHILPFVTKEDIQGNPRAFLSERAHSKLRVVRTGGATGTPMQFFLDPQTCACSMADMIRCRRWWGIDLGDRAVNFWGHSASFSPGLRGKLEKRLIRPFKDRIMNRRVLSAYDMSPGSMARYWRVIQRFRPPMLLGYASTVYVFASFLRENGIDGREAGIKVVVTCAEILYDWQRELIQDVFGCGVANEYGATEVGIIAYGCPCGLIHTVDEHVYVEVLKENPEDEFGELVITHLCNLSAPLIRYRIQDLAIPAGLEEECTYGLGLHSLRAVVGRQHDLIRLSSGRVVHGEFFTHIFDHMKGVKRFQVIQRRPDAFEISIVKGFGYGDSQEQFLRARIHEHLGSVEVRIRYASSIQGEASGKFRWVKSEVERQDDQYPTISRAD